MKEKILDLKKVNIISMFLSPAIFIAFMIPYALFTTVSIKENFTLWTLFFIIIGSVLGIIIHELIHALFFALYTNSGFKSIRFGAYWKHLAFYCHCEEPIKVKHYRITLLMPVVILGFIPLILAYIFQNFGLLFFACLMISGGIGDFICVFLLRNMDKDTKVLDHPESPGFIIP